MKEIDGKIIYCYIPHNKIELCGISHDRYVDQDTGEVNSKGGHTVCNLKMDGEDYIGIAFCSRKTKFCETKGTRLAILKAFTHYWTFIRGIFK